MNTIRIKWLVIGVGFALVMPALAGADSVCRRSFDYDELARLQVAQEPDPSSGRPNCYEN